MTSATPTFLDDSALRQCSPSQLLQVLAVQNHDYFVEAETLDWARAIRDLSWIETPLGTGQLTEHHICDLEKIRLIGKIEKLCGASRSEIASRVAAKSQDGILITKDTRVQSLLQHHIPGVPVVELAHFLLSNELLGEVIFAPSTETTRALSLSPKSASNSPVYGDSM